MSRDFNIWAPMAFFEKAGAPKGQKRRVAGIISTDQRDKQDEVILQRGLDFKEFMTEGFYNDNHDKATDSPIGVPTGVQYFSKGAKLPDGKSAPRNLHWAEGYLLNTPRASKVWELGKALKEAGGDRSLGFSIEGRITKRQGSDRRTIAKAKVRNVAITNCPVNPGTKMDVLVKSLHEAEADELFDLEDTDKSLTAGTPATPGEAPVGPRTGEGAGEVLTGESLEGGPDDEKERKRKLKKMFQPSMSKSEAVAWLAERLPKASMQTLGRIVDLTVARQRSER